MAVEAEERDCLVIKPCCRDGSRSRGKILLSNQTTVELVVEAEERDCLAIKLLQRWP